jgi:hypothetical protein
MNRQGFKPEAGSSPPVHTQYIMNISMALHISELTQDAKKKDDDFHQEDATDAVIVRTFPLRGNCERWCSSNLCVCGRMYVYVCVCLCVCVK